MCYQSELIDCLKEVLYIQSDYAISQRWQIEPTRISQYRKNRLRLPIRFVIDIANETGTSALMILEKLEKERLMKRGKLEAVFNWRPNENVKRYPPPWVERKHFFRRKR